MKHMSYAKNQITQQKTDISISVKDKLSDHKYKAQ